MARLTNICFNDLCSEVPETYSKAEIDALVGGLESVSFEVVDELPQTGESNVIYLVPKTGDGYTQWVYTADDEWISIGSTDVDLSNYYTKTEVDAIIDAIYPVGSIYMSMNNTDPKLIFGGTWERVTGKFLLGASDNGASGTNIQGNANVLAGGQGGEAGHVLTAGESGLKGHTHGLNNHTHGFSWSGSHRHYPDKTSGQGGRDGWCTYKTASAFRTRAKVDSSGRYTFMTAASGAQDDLGFVWYTDAVTINVSGNTGGNSGNTTQNGEQSGASHNNMPPFLAVYIWKRVS